MLALFLWSNNSIFRKVKLETHIRVMVIAINFFGRENIRRAIAEEEYTSIELMHMDAEDISNITNSLRGLFL